jgi:hypothetical protein
MRLKQRIVRILIREIIADVDEKNREVVLVIHWAGGRHTELRVKKFETGRSRRSTAPETIEVLRQMAGKFSDRQIAATMNRLRLRTGEGDSWNEMRVRSARSYYQLPAFRQDDQAKAKEVTVKIAAQRLDVSEWIVRRMIEEKILPARQVIVCALANSSGSVGFRGSPSTGHEFQEPSASSAKHQDEEQEALFS